MTTTREQAELEYERIATESLNGEFLSVLITDALESKIKRIAEDFEISTEVSSRIEKLRKA